MLVINCYFVYSRDNKGGISTKQQFHFNLLLYTWDLLNFEINNFIIEN